MLDTPNLKTSDVGRLAAGEAEEQLGGCDCGCLNAVVASATKADLEGNAEELFGVEDEEDNKDMEEDGEEEEEVVAVAVVIFTAVLISPPGSSDPLSPASAEGLADFSTEGEGEE